MLRAGLRLDGGRGCLPITARQFHVEWDVRVRGVPVSVKNVSKEAVGAGLVWSSQGNLVPLWGGDQIGHLCRLRLGVAANLGFGTFLHDFPTVGERILVGIAGRHFGSVGLSRMQPDVLRAALSIHPNSFQARTAVGGPATRPD